MISGVMYQVLSAQLQAEPTDNVFSTLYQFDKFRENTVMTL